MPIFKHQLKTFLFQDVLNEELGEVKRIQTTLAGLRQPSSQERQSYDGFPMGGHVKKDPDVWDPPPPRSKLGGIPKILFLNV